MEKTVEPSLLHSSTLERKRMGVGGCQRPGVIRNPVCCLGAWGPYREVRQPVLQLANTPHWAGDLPERCPHGTCARLGTGERESQKARPGLKLTGSVKLT